MDNGGAGRAAAGGAGTVPAAGGTGGGASATKGVRWGRAEVNEYATTLVAENDGTFKKTLDWELISQYTTTLRSNSSGGVPPLPPVAAAAAAAGGLSAPGWAGGSSASSSSSAAYSGTGAAGTPAGFSNGSAASAPGSAASSSFPSLLSTPFSPPPPPLQQQGQAQLQQQYTPPGSLGGAPSLASPLQQMSLSAPQSSSSSSSSSGAATAPSSVLSPAAAGSAAPASSSRPTVGQVKKVVPVSGWHIKADGCIWQGPVEHSSRVIGWPGDPVVGMDGRSGPLAPNQVLTMNGTVYVLQDLDVKVRSVLLRMFPGFSDATPLQRGSEQAMLLAEQLVYGPASSKVFQLGKLLSELEVEVRSAAVAGGGSVMDKEVAGQFAKVREVLGTLGIVLSGP